MTTLVPGIVLESRRKQPLVLAPAMGVHLTHHSRDHYIVDNTTKVVCDRHHGGIKLDYKFNEVFATSNGPYKSLETESMTFRRGGQAIPKRSASSQVTQIKVDPYSHGVIISSPSFAQDYKLRIPASNYWDPPLLIRGMPASPAGRRLNQFVTSQSIPTLLRSASPMITSHPDDWQSSGEDDDSAENLKTSTDYMPRPDAPEGLMGSASSWETRAVDKTCDRRMSTTKRDVNPIFIGKRSLRNNETNDRVTGMSFNSKLSIASGLELEDSCTPLRLSRCYLTWESLHVIANRDGTIARRPVLEYHFVYVYDDGKLPSTVLDAYTNAPTSIEGDEVRCVVTYMISESEDAEDLPLLDVLFGTPKFLEQVERQCSTRDTERDVSARSMLSIGEIMAAKDLEDSIIDDLPTLPSGSTLVKMSSSLSNNPIRLARSFSGKLARQLSAEESHGVWRTLRRWDLDFDFKLGTTPCGLYSLMNHNFTFLHYTDHQHRSIDWFVADISAPASQIDALVRPIVNLRQCPYTVNRDELLGIAHFQFHK